MQRLPALHRFLERWVDRCSVPNGSVEGARRFLAAKGRDLEDRVLIGFNGGSLGACAFLHFEPEISRCVAEVWLARDASGADLAVPLLAAALERASSADLEILHVPALPGSQLQEQLESASFRRVRHYASWELEPGAFRTGSRAGPTLRTRRYVDPEDSALVAELQNSCFRGSFGFQPNTPEQISAYVLQRGGSENLSIAFNGSGVLVGYAWVSETDQSGPGPSGRIEMAGVHPDHRRQGYGNSIVSAGVAELLARGVARVVLDVDRENRAALSLYRSLGFKECFTYAWFEKRASRAPT